MRPITDPSHVDHPALRELALAAAWVAQLEEAVEVLEDLVGDFGEDEEAPGGDTGDPDDPGAPADEDPLAVALAVVQERYEEEDRRLEERLAHWLAEDPEHWPIFRLVVLDPWQTEPGRWRAGVPGWIRSLGTDAVLAHFQHDPFGRQVMLDVDG